LQLLAELLANAGHLQEAQDLVWPRADKDPMWAFRCLAIAENLPGPVQEKWVDRMSPMLDKSAAGQMALGKALFKVAQKNETKVNYERAIAMFKGAVDDTAFRNQAAFFLGSCYEQIGDKAGAIRCYRMAIEANPNDALALNNLAFLLTDDPGTAPEAATLAKKAVDLGSVPGYDSSLLQSFLDTLGVALLRCEKPKEAEAAFRKGLEMNPNTLDLNVGLAEARLNQGFPEDAKRILGIWDTQSPTGSSQDASLGKRVADIRRRLQDAK
jgi:tetratricopeptide (TPR) repeat protein